MSSWYSDYPVRRARQIVADIVAVAVIILAILAGVTVSATISAFADVGIRMAQAGQGFEDTMTDAGETLGGVPIIGESIRGPFESASGAGGALVDAGEALQQVVRNVATGAGILVALGPILIVLAVWLLPRLVFLRRARETRALLGSKNGPELLALRALTRSPIQDLSAVSATPLEDWREGDRNAIAGLARLELVRAGVRG